MVFCGSAAGRVSALRGAYYAGPGNRFWPTLAAIGLTPGLVAPAAFRTVTRFGLGLTDMNKTQSGADSSLGAHGDDADALREKVLRYRPRVLAFVGKRAARAFLGHAIARYGLQPERITETRLWVLPSPSGAARRFWDEAPWRTLVTFIHGIKTGA